METIESSPPSLSDDFVQVDRKIIRLVWPVVSKILEPVFPRCYGKVSPEDVVEYVETGIAQLWVQYLDGEPAAVVVTAIERYPSRDVLKVMLAAGKDAKRWKPYAQHAVEEFARATGCSSVEIVGRRGWGKVYPDYEEIEVVYAKEM